MNRRKTFHTEEIGGMRGLASLTEPGPDDSVGAVVDIAVIGARGDGKTQFIVHAIRTLRAYAPLLEGAEHQYNREVLQVVMNAREPRPEATAPGVVPHYVFRIRPESLLSQVGLAGRLGLYARVAGLWRYALVALVNAAVVAGALTGLRGGLDGVVMAAGAGLALLGMLLGSAFARHRFIRRGDIEVVFWDVAGEHVYSASAVDYYSFLGALVRMRRQRAQAHHASARSYAFAPVLICNPVALGPRAEGSAYTRLRQLMPMFASLNEPLPRALVAINRWAVVQAICAPDSDREETVAVVSRARATEDMEPDAADTIAEPAMSARSLPVVKRDVVRKHCLDAEDGKDESDSDVHISYLRYDAGIQAELEEQPWAAWTGTEMAQGWRAPTTTSPAKVLHYVFEDGPGSFRGEVRRQFLDWVARLAFHHASYAGKQRRPAAEIVEDDDEDRPAAGPATAPAPAPANEPSFARADSEPAFTRAATDAPFTRPAADAPFTRPAADAPYARPVRHAPEELAPVATAADLEDLSDAIDASLEDEPAPGATTPPSGLRRRGNTQPGIGPERAGSSPSDNEPPQPSTNEPPQPSDNEPPPALHGPAAPAPGDPPASPKRHSATLRLPGGGFGNRGT